MKDRAILLYAMTKGFQFDIGSINERGLIESTQGRCTDTLFTHYIAMPTSRGPDVGL